MIQKEQRKAGGCGESFIKRIFPVLAVITALILTACGGGGGSDGTVQRDILPEPDVPATTLQYTGMVDMAAITETNAVEMAVGALHGGPGEQSPVVLGASAEVGVETTALPTTLPFDYRQIMVAAKRVLDGDFSPSTPRTIETITGTEPGPCGGSMTLTLNVSDQFPDFTGTMFLDNYCEGEVTQNGLIGIKGRAFPETGEFDYMTMYFGACIVSTASGSVTLGGSVTADFISSNTLTMTMDYLVQDNGTGTVYKVENYVVTEVEGGDYEQNSISSGLYYNPVYGYVEVNTVTAFIEYVGDYGPSSGALSVAGSELTKTLLTCLSSNVYQVEADTTGDGSYDWYSGNLHWTDFNMYTGINYTGATTMTAIDEQNAVEMSVGALVGGPGNQDLSPTLGPLAAATSLSAPSADTTFDFSQAVATLEKALAEEGPSAGVSAIQSDTLTYYGTCGGSLTIALQIDDVSGNFTGSMVYNDFCEDGVTEAGEILLSGTVDLSTLDIVQMTLTIESMTVSSESGSFTLAGTVIASSVPPVLTMTMNYRVRDDGTGKVYMVENYVVSEETVDGESGPYEQKTISGLYYHPDYGYVEVTTVTPFRHYGHTWPVEGALSVAGSELTTALLTCLQATVYQVEADTTGDGSYDWYSGNLSWLEFNTLPVADAGPDQSVTVGSLVTLDGSGSFDSDGDILYYSWTFVTVPEGSGAVLSDQITANPTFTADLTGVYSLELTVVDGYAEAVDQVNVTAE